MINFLNKIIKINQTMKDLGMVGKNNCDVRAKILNCVYGKVCFHDFRY